MTVRALAALMCFLSWSITASLELSLEITIWGTFYFILFPERFLFTQVTNKRLSSILYTILYYTVLYCTVLYCTHHHDPDQEESVGTQQDHDGQLVGVEVDLVV